MNKTKLQNKGFTSVETILVIVIVGLIGVVGWLVYSKNNDNSKQVSNSKTATQSPTKKSPTATAENTLKIPEMGIQLVNIPSSIKDLNYQAHSGNQYIKATVSLSTKSLDNLNPNCGLEGLNSYDGTYNSSTDQYPRTSFVKQFDTFWVASTGLEIPCGEEGTPPVDLQSAQIQTLNQYLKNSENVQKIK